jgi:ABC-type transport system substrate-binding protein
MWAEVGLKVKLQQVESGISQFKDPGIYGIVQSGMESGLDPNYMFTYYSRVLPPECCNHPRFVNDEAIGYLQTGQQEFEREKRQDAYWGLQRLLNDELPRLWLFKVPMLFAKTKKLQNVKMTPHYGSYSWDPVVNAEDWTLES